MAKPAPLTPELLGVRKGSARPSSELPPQSGQATPRVASSSPAPPLVAPPPGEEPRIALTVRLPVSTLERLREAAHRTRLEKQSIADEALRAWLDERGF